jgi:hypothetical protein
MSAPASPDARGFKGVTTTSRALCPLHERGVNLDPCFEMYIASVS